MAKAALLYGSRRPDSGYPRVMDPESIAPPGDDIQHRKTMGCGSEATGNREEWHGCRCDETLAGVTTGHPLILASAPAYHPGEVETVVEHAGLLPPVASDSAFMGELGGIGDRDPGPAFFSAFLEASRRPCVLSSGTPQNLATTHRTLKPTPSRRNLEASKETYMSNDETTIRERRA